MDDGSPGQPISKTVATMRAQNRRVNFGRRRHTTYTNWIDEQMAGKESCSLGDWTFLENIVVEGPDALDVFADLSVNSFEDYAIGQAKHVVQCDEDGKVVAEGVLVRLDDDAFELHGIPCNWTAFNIDTGDYDATYEWRDTFNFQVQGPNALDVLETVSEGGSLDHVEFVHSGMITIAGHEVRAVRFAMGNEVGFELQGPGEYGEEVWDAIFALEDEYDIQRLGVNTSSIPFLETCIPTRTRDYVSAVHGEDMRPFREWLDENSQRDIVNHPIEGSFEASDISAWYRSPVELGWEHYIAFDHDFVGREALEAEVADPERTIVTLEWNDEDVIDIYASLYRSGPTNKFMDMPHQQKRAMVADSVRLDGEEVGVSTMRGYSYYFRKMLSLCVIDVEHAEPGTEVTVLWGEGGDPETPTVEAHEQKVVRATVAPAPYIEDKRRQDISDRATE